MTGRKLHLSRKAAAVPTIICPHCGRRFTCTQELRGRPVRCPVCKGEFVVPPAPQRTGAAPTPTAAATPAPAPRGGRPPSTTQDTNIGCPHCGQRFVMAPHLSGREVACPACQGQFMVPIRTEPAAAAPHAGACTRGHGSAGRPQDPPPPAECPPVVAHRVSEQPATAEYVPTLKCPHCGGFLSASSEIQGNSYTCPCCGGQFRAPMVSEQVTTAVPEAPAPCAAGNTESSSPWFIRTTAERGRRDSVGTRARQCGQAAAALVRAIRTRKGLTALAVGGPVLLCLLWIPFSAIYESSSWPTGVQPTKKWQRGAVLWIMTTANEPNKVEIVSYGEDPQFTKTWITPDGNYVAEGYYTHVFYRDTTVFGGRAVFRASLLFDDKQNLTNAKARLQW